MESIDVTNEQIQAAIDKAGLRLVPKDHTTELENLKSQMATLASEAREAFGAAKDTAKEMSVLGGQVMPLLQDIRQDLRNVLGRVAYLETAKSAHAETLTSHEADITGLHRRLIVVEGIVTNLPLPVATALKRPSRKKAKKK